MCGYELQIMGWVLLTNYSVISAEYSMWLGVNMFLADFRCMVL